jgi:hypothetical protein
VIEPYQIAEAGYRIRRDAALDQRRDRGMDLIVACKSRSNNPSLKRPIGSAAPESNCGI